MKFNSMLQKMQSTSKVRLLLTIGVAILSILLSITVSVAWISQNMKTNSNNLMFSLSPDLMDAFSESGRFLLVKDGGDEELVGQPSRSFLPGTSQTFFIGMFNKSKSHIDISSFGIEVPTVWYDGVTDVNGQTVAYANASNTGNDTIFNEIPLLDNGTYYYLGQNCRLAVTGYKIYNAELSSNTVRLKGVVKEVTTGSTGSLLLPSDVTSISRIELVNVASLGSDASIVLGPNQAVLFEMSLEFVNQSTDQSVFKGFGTAAIGGLCKRVVYATFTQTQN